MRTGEESGESSGCKALRLEGALWAGGTAESKVRGDGKSGLRGPVQEGCVGFGFYSE